jgi:hypothetical protein
VGTGDLAGGAADDAAASSDAESTGDGSDAGRDVGAFDAGKEVATLDGGLDAPALDSAALDAAKDSGSDSASLDASHPDSSPTDAGKPCNNDLSNIGTGDFTISLRMTTAQSGRQAVVNQRSVCNSGDFWEVEVTTANELQLETDGTSHVLVNPTPTVSDGKPHDVVIKRVAQQVTITIDGTVAPGGTAPCTSAFGALAALRITTSVCSGEAPFVGSITNVCITSP